MKLADITFSTNHIVRLISTLVVWLHLRAGISRNVANLLLQAIQLIISAILALVETSLVLSGVNMSLPKFKIPQDVRTAYRNHFTEPIISRTVCCPKCFSIFSSGGNNIIPQKCQWKASPRSRSCNTNLWKLSSTPKGPKWVPKCLYTTQSFDAWLKVFLSRKIIDTSLEETFRKRRGNSTAAFGATMHDVQDSPAWKNLFRVDDSPHKLVFGLYVDWFNPFTNKIAGKFQLMAIIHVARTSSYCVNRKKGFMWYNCFILLKLATTSSISAREYFCSWSYYRSNSSYS